MTASVTSLRKVDWDSFRVNFFALFPPGPLDAMPATYIAAFRPPDDRTARGSRRSCRSIRTCSRSTSARSCGRCRGSWTTCRARSSSCSCSRCRRACSCCRRRSPRRRTSAGSTPRSCARSARRSEQLRAAQIAEFLVLGALAGLVAAAGATAIGWVLADRVFKIPFEANPMVWVYGIARRRDRGHARRLARHARDDAAAAARGDPAADVVLYCFPA